MGIETAATLAAGIAPAAQITSIDEQKRSGRNQIRASKAQQRLQDIKATRERRAQFRQAQKAQAEIIAGGVASGTSKSSSVKQGVGSVQTQLASNISFLDETIGLNRETSIFNQKAADASSRAATADAIFDTSLKAASLFAPN